MGAALAAKEKGDRRVILFTGEGSWMLSIQEISTLVRQVSCSCTHAPSRRDSNRRPTDYSQGLKPICIVINNKGYAIERRIHGEKAKCVCLA